nr:GAF domain-containing protein [Thermoanaerobaculia bacterium]
MSPDTHPHHPHSPRSHPSDDARPLTIRRLKWIAFAASLGFVVVLETARHALFPYLTGWGGNLLLDGFVFVATLFFLGGVFDVIERIHLQLERKNRELTALRQAGLLVFSELSEEVVLQKVVDQARQLVATKYGALSVLAEAGGILAFVTSGIDPAERSRIGSPPVGRGVLGVTLHHGHAMRVSELSGHPESVGFPANHPPMKSLLAVPIPCKMPFRGNLYLCDKVDGTPFDANDEATLGHFAVSAAIAIDNAELHRRAGELAASEERLRLAHEMHDGLAQVLAYVEEVEAVSRSIALRKRALQEKVKNARQEESLSERDRALLKHGVRAWVDEILALPPDWQYDPGVAWDEIGIDMLVVDEAAAFKNL